MIINGTMYEWNVLLAQNTLQNSVQDFFQVIINQLSFTEQMVIFTLILSNLIV